MALMNQTEPSPTDQTVPAPQAGGYKACLEKDPEGTYYVYLDEEESNASVPDMAHGGVEPPASPEEAPDQRGEPIPTFEGALKALVQIEKQHGQGGSEQSAFEGEYASKNPKAGY